MDCEYLINHFDTHDSAFLPRWVLIDRVEYERKLSKAEREHIIRGDGELKAGVLGEFATLSELMKAIAEHQWQQDRLIAAARPEPAPADTGPRPGGIRDMALQKIK